MNELIRRAEDFAIMVHVGQVDDDGKNYFLAHIVEVISMIKIISDDPEVIAAAYLHDTIEDTSVTYEDLVREFGRRVANLVMEVTHEGQADEHGYYFPRLKTAEGIMIKLCDRASNISRMGSWTEERKEHYLKRTKFWKSINGEIKNDR